jgi:O-antigen/teichoic acid export membrane protein
VVLLAGYKVVAMGLVVLLATIPEKLLLMYFAHKSLPYLHINSRHWSRDTAKTIFSYAGYAFVARIADLLRFQIDNPVVAAFVGVGAVTHYKIAGSLAQYFRELMVDATQPLPSVFSRQEGAKDNEGLKRTVFLTTKLATSVSCFIAFGLIVWGKPFIIRWVGLRYVDAYPCLLVLVAGLVVSMSQLPSGAVLWGTSRHRFLALTNVVEGAVKLVLCLLLVKRYGMLGVALGTAIPSVIARIGVQPVYFCHVTGIRYLAYMWNVGRSLVLIAAGLAIPYLLSVRLVGPNLKALFAVGLLSLVCYGLVIWFFQFSPSESKVLRRAIWPWPAVEPARD